MGGGLSKNSSSGGGEVPLEPNAKEMPSSTASSPVRPASLSPSKSPEMAAIKIPEATKELPVPSDPRSPTIDMSRTPLVEAAPFVDPRSPDNTILRTPLDKNSGFKGFALDDSLPYIDESQESTKPSSTPPKLSLSPLNLDASGEDELEGGGGGGGGAGGATTRRAVLDEVATDSDVITDSSEELSPRTPPGNSVDAVKEFDAAIGEQLEKEDAFNDAGVLSGDDAGIDDAAITSTVDAAAAAFYADGYPLENYNIGAVSSSHHPYFTQQRQQQQLQRRQQPTSPFFVFPPVLSTSPSNSIPSQFRFEFGNRESKPLFPSSQR